MHMNAHVWGAHVPAHSRDSDFFLTLPLNLEILLTFVTSDQGFGARVSEGWFRLHSSWLNTDNLASLHQPSACQLVQSGHPSLGWTDARSCSDRWSVHSFLWVGRAWHFIISVWRSRIILSAIEYGRNCVRKFGAAWSLLPFCLLFKLTKAEKQPPFILTAFALLVHHE